MKLFISWSGDFSREVAEKLSGWIPTVIQSVETFYSPDDIGKGENWNHRLSDELERCNFGIICLTPENVTAPWIHFEAGSLAKAISTNARLSSIMLGITPSDIKGPLSRFQNTKFERHDFFKLMKAINHASEKPLGPNTLNKLFDIMWGEFEKDVQNIIQKYKVVPKKETKATIQQNDHEAIQEILSVLRKMSGDSVLFSPVPTNKVPSDFHENILTSEPTIQTIRIVITNFGYNPPPVLEIITRFFPHSYSEIVHLMDRKNGVTIVVPKPAAKQVIMELYSAGASYTVMR